MRARDRSDRVTGWLGSGLVVFAGLVAASCTDEQIFIVPAPEPGDAGARDASIISDVPDLGRLDLGRPDLGRPDLGVPDLGAPDLGPSDTGPVDVGELPPPAVDVMLTNGAELFGYDPVADALTWIGILWDANRDVVDSMLDIAVDHRGRLFGVSLSAVWRIDPRDGRITRIFDIAEPATGLGFDRDGRMVLAGEDLRFVDPDTLQLLARYEPPDGLMTSGDLVTLPDGTLYWTVLSSGGGDQLVRLNLVSQPFDVVGTLADTPNVWGLGYANGRMLGFASTGEIVEIQIEPEGPVVVVVARTDETWWGAATVLAPR